MSAPVFVDVGESLVRADQIESVGRIGTVRTFSGADYHPSARESRGTILARIARALTPQENA